MIAGMIAVPTTQAQATEAEDVGAQTEQTVTADSQTATSDEQVEIADEQTVVTQESEETTYGNELSSETYSNAQLESSYPSCFFFSSADRNASNLIVSATYPTGYVSPIYIQWFREYNHEKYYAELVNSSGKVVSTASGSLSGSSYIVNLTISWNMSGLSVGNYKLIVHKYFYSLYSWHETPSTSVLRVTLVDGSKNGLVKGSNGWGYYKRGVLVTSANGLYKNSSGWWYVKNGLVQFGYTAIPV